MKRVFDFIMAFLGLVVLSPIIVASMIAIRRESSGPSIFAQPRIGRGGREFICYKLRTMYEHTVQSPTHDMDSSALTPLGRALRRWKIDELPQLYNVLRGEMSIVGPRPCLPSQTALIHARLQIHALDVRPGLTGLAQVRGIDMSNPARLADIDGVYARTRSFGGDMWLILQTFGAIARHKSSL